MGRWTGGHAAIVARLARPDAFGHVFAVSVLARDERDALVSRIRDGKATDVRFRLVWNLHERWDGGETTRALSGALDAAGQNVDGGESNGSAGWGGWRLQAGEALATFFP